MGFYPLQMSHKFGQYAKNYAQIQTKQLYTRLALVILSFNVSTLYLEKRYIKPNGGASPHIIPKKVVFGVALKKR